MPVDNIKIQLNERLPQVAFKSTEPFEFRDLLFSPCYSKTGELYGFTSELQNLKIRMLLSTNRIIIENSLHKYLDTSNHSDFPVSGLKKAIERLSDHLHIDIREGVIKKIECGCNINVPDATEAWRRLRSYKGNEYLPQNFKGKEYGANCYFTQYVLKAYNKSEERRANSIKAPENLFRWELKVQKMDVLHSCKSPVPVFKVDDLTDPTKIQYLCDMTANKYADSVKVYRPDMSQFSLNTLTAIARQSHPQVKEMIRMSHLHTFRADNRVFNQEMKKAAERGDKVLSQIVEKFRELING